MKPVIWTGLPRTRSRWAAEYFDGIENVIGLHEPTNGLKSKQEFYDLMENDQPEQVVISDSGIFITDFQERYPDTKTVIIERDTEDVFKSLCDYFNEQGYSRPSMKFLHDQKAAVDALEGLRVRYEDINKRLPEIHEYFGIPYDALYADRMTARNLQIPVLTVDVESYKLWGAF